MSLELAANATAMVVAYDMSWLSWQIMSRMAKIDTVTLVNLICGEKVVPEFLGPDCKPDLIAGAILDLLDKSDTRDAQLQAMEKTMRDLGRGGPPPGERAAQSVLNALKIGAR